MTTTKVVAGNWKMHHGPEEASRFFSRFHPDLAGAAVRLLLFPPDLALAASRESARIPIEFGVQNVHWEPAGPFTGETSPEMAREAGASFALVGHSERRHVFGETDTDVNRKVGASIRAGLNPVVCVGERLEERRAGRLEEVLRRQVGATLGSLKEAAEFMIAYEPVWAIGTGETASPEDAAEAHGIVREALGEMAAAPILYGGSVNPGNAAALMTAPGVDGVLVGGGSLDAVGFTRIAQAAVRSAMSV